MKVFWSWQSDSPDKIGRHFIRETLETVIKDLKEEIEALEEPDREIHLDHDRKGVPGSPDLANTILEKIKATTIFIADVTPVGETPNGKALINPNVAIELGFALAHIGDQGILMVLNQHYGDRQTLPFDLKHKAGPIIYSIGPSATTKEIQKEKRLLSGKFKDEIRACIKALKKESNKKITKHTEIKSIGNSAKYFEYGEILAERSYNNKVLRVVYNSGPIIYLRIIPVLAVNPLKQHEVKDIIYGVNISPLQSNLYIGASWERNRYGGITFSHINVAEGKKVFTTSQVFLNREIWGLDATFFHGSKKIISIMAFEELIEDALRHYVDVAEKRLNLNPPLLVEAGAAEVNDFTMVRPSHYPTRRNLGRIFSNEIKSRHTLKSLEKTDVDKVLLAIFEDFFDAIGVKRPDNFRNFPAAKEEN
jgi:hypothetical protein